MPLAPAAAAIVAMSSSARAGSTPALRAPSAATRKASVRRAVAGQDRERLAVDDVYRPGGRGGARRRPSPEGPSCTSEYAWTSSIAQPNGSASAGAAGTASHVGERQDRPYALSRPRSTA
jgi:hypothetical protein